MECINCKKHHQEAYCPACGQKGAVPRITFQSLTQSAFSTVTNMDRGFLQNIKELTKNPQGIVLDYLAGKRKGIYNPVSFLIITVTTYLIVESLLHTPMQGSGNDSELYTLGYEAGRFIKLNLRYFWILSIVWLSISNKLMFGKFNLAEHLTISSFIVGQATIVGILSLLVFDWILVFNPLVYLTMFLILLQIFKSKGDELEWVIKSIFSMFLFLLQLFILVIVAGYIRMQL